MKFRVARYYRDSNRRDWDVVIYQYTVDPEKYPHDWWTIESRYRWRRMGGQDATQGW